MSVNMHTNSESDEYLKKFESLDTDIANIVSLVNKIESQPDDQHRLYVAIDCIRALIKHNMKISDLLVEMNNFFAPE